VSQVSKEDILKQFGFRFGKFSVHTSRTMMLSELTTLLAASASDATKKEFFSAIIQHNLLGKSTLTARQLTAEHLAELYILDVDVCLFRVLRNFWLREERSHPVLALLCALARDTLLRASVECIMQVHQGEQLTTADMVTFLNDLLPGRFSRATITSISQNVNSSWTQAGYLFGKVNKKRSHPIITPAVVAYALFLAYLDGARAQRLFDSIWVRVLNISKDKAHELAIAASRHGWLDYRRAGEIIDIRFPELLNVREQELLSEQT
jgi:hypothetical protein